MLYMKCPTCGYFLGQHTYEYEEKKQNICSNPSLDEEQKSKQITKLLLSFDLDPCCNMRFMSYKKLVEIILPIPQQKDN